MRVEKSTLSIGLRQVPIEIECYDGMYLVSEADYDIGMPMRCHEDKQTAIELFRELLEDAEDEGGRPFEPRSEYLRDADFSRKLRGAQL